MEAALYDDDYNAMFDEIWYVYTSVEKPHQASDGKPRLARKMPGHHGKSGIRGRLLSFATRVLTTTAD